MPLHRQNVADTLNKLNARELNEKAAAITGYGVSPAYSSLNVSHCGSNFQAANTERSAFHLHWLLPLSSCLIVLFVSESESSCSGADASLHGSKFESTS